MSFSDAQENATLDQRFGAWTANPPNVYVSLHDGNPGDDGAGGTEHSWTGYARVQHDNWNAAAAGRVTNNGVILFGTPSGAGLPQATHVALWDSASLSAPANLLAVATITPAKQIIAGNPPQIADGAFEFNLD